MKRALTILAAGLMLGAFAATQAKLPPPTPEEMAAAAANAQKAETEKAKAAQQVSRAQDRAVASYRKNKGKDASSAGATAQHGQSQGAEHSNARLPDSELTPREAQTQMPKPGQVNDYSTPARDPQNSSRSR